MKKNFIYPMLVLLIMGFMLPSCKSNDNDSDPGIELTEEHDRTKPAVTVMLYCVGGGDLDALEDGDIYDAANAMFKEDVSVRFFVQMKYSDRDTYWEKLENKNGKPLTEQERKDYTPYGESNTVYRYELLPSLLKNQKIALTKDLIFGQYAGTEFHQPDSIAHFINYCHSQNPQAQHHVLILSNHGGGYNVSMDFDKSQRPNSAPQMRMGVNYDPAANNDCTNLDELHEGIARGLRLSGLQKLDVLYYDCCLMNGIEVVSGMTDVADYILASGHTTTGGDYRNMLDQLYLAVGGHKTFLQAWKDYTTRSSEIHYERYIKTKSITNKYVDWVLTDSKAFEAVLPKMKTFVDAICAKYDKDINAGVSESDLFDKYKDAACKCYHYCDDAPIYDLSDYAKRLTEAMKDAEVTDAYQALEASLKSAQVSHTYADKNNIKKDLSYTINLGAKGFLRFEFNDEEGLGMFECYDYLGRLGYYYRADNTVQLSDDKRDDGDKPLYAWKNSYDKTKFEKETGWTRWLKRNPVMPDDINDYEGDIVFY